jgi:hypothetical protein
VTQPQQYAQQPAPGTDPWQQAAQQYGGQPAQPQQFQQGQAGYGQQYQAPAQPQQYATASNLADAYAPDDDAESQLFTAGTTALSLFNKTHGLGMERSGVITAAPKDVQDLDFDTRSPKYWATTRVPGQKPITADPIDRTTGQRNKPVLSTHLDLSTDYRVTGQEWVAIGRKDEFREGEDDGARKYVASGQGLKALRDAIAAANRNGIKIAKGEDLVGLRITVKRAGQKPNPVGNPSWIQEITLSRP